MPIIEAYKPGRDIAWEESTSQGKISRKGTIFAKGPTIDGASSIWVVPNTRREEEAPAIALRVHHSGRRTGQVSQTYMLDRISRALYQECLREAYAQLWAENNRQRYSKIHVAANELGNRLYNVALDAVKEKRAERVPANWKELAESAPTESARYFWKRKVHRFVYGLSEV